MPFEFATATRIVFGPGRLKEAGPAAAALGRRALVVTGRHAHRAEPLLALLREAGLTHQIYSIAGEPKVDEVSAGAELVRRQECDLVIGMGGGSAIDAAKAIASLATNEGDALDFLEVIGKGRPLTKPSRPFIAIPTTAGTGAEVTRNAVLHSPEHKVKVSLRSPWLLARLAIVDPELTLDMPPSITASTGLDALTQLIEPFVSCRANPMTDGFCREGLSRIARALRVAFAQPDNTAAREDMALASLLGGLALANAGLGAVHGFAAPLGGMFPAPHGAICAALLPPTMRINVQALRGRAPDAPALDRYQEIARILTGREDDSVEEGIDWVASLCRDLRIAGLRTYGVTQNDMDPLCLNASQASSMKANPLPLTQSELRTIVEQSL